MSVWDILVGQPAVIDQLAAAAADAADPVDPGPAMVQSWLITGPPGSGRSTAAACFAAALMCPDQGCGTCHTCRTAQVGTHRDVVIVRAEALSYGVDDARALVEESSVLPADSPWRVVIVEDADRLTDLAANALLKAVEEPPPRMVWLLCAPSAEDVLPTIRSRTRHLQLRTPSTPEVAQALMSRFGVDPAMAAFAARASQGHIGRARALATDEAVRLRRQEVLRAPGSLRDLAACFSVAGDLVAAATEDAHAITDPIDAKEQAELRQAYGEGADGVTKARLDRLTAKPMKDLKKAQDTRRKRGIRDQLDRALLDLAAFYRDVLILQVGAEQPLLNDEMRPQITQTAAQGTPADTVRRLDAIEESRLAIGAAGDPRIVLEALMVRLKDPRVTSR